MPLEKKNQLFPAHKWQKQSKSVSFFLSQKSHKFLSKKHPFGAYISAQRCFFLFRDLLTLWPLRWTFKFQRTISVKWEYFVTLKKCNIVKYMASCRGINGYGASKSKKVIQYIVDYIYIYIYIRSVQWWEALRLSYIQDAWCLMVNSSHIKKTRAAEDMTLCSTQSIGLWSRNMSVAVK